MIVQRSVLIAIILLEERTSFKVHRANKSNVGKYVCAAREILLLIWRNCKQLPEALVNKPSKICAVSSKE